MNINDLNYDELPFFKETIRVHFSKQLNYSSRDNLSIKPRLVEEHFREFKGKDVYFCIELKSGRTEEVRKAFNLVKKLGMEDQVTLGVGHTSVEEVQKQVGKFTCFFDKKNIMKMFISFFCGTIFLLFW